MIKTKTVDSDSLAIFSSGNNYTLWVTSGFEGGKQSLTLQLTIPQHWLTVFSDHLPHQRLPHGLIGYRTAHNVSYWEFLPLKQHTQCDTLWDTFTSSHRFCCYTVDNTIKHAFKSGEHVTVSLPALSGSLRPGPAAKLQTSLPSCVPANTE